jgi:hypothetical protein
MSPYSVTKRTSTASTVKFLSVLLVTPRREGAVNVFDQEDGILGNGRCSALKERVINARRDPSSEKSQRIANRHTAWRPVTSSRFPGLEHLLVRILWMLTALSSSAK